MDLEETNSTLSNTNITCGEETLYHLLFSNEFNQQHQNLDDSYLYLQFYFIQFFLPPTTFTCQTQKILLWG